MKKTLRILLALLLVSIMLLGSLAGCTPKTDDPGTSPSASPGATSPSPSPGSSPGTGTTDTGSDEKLSFFWMGYQGHQPPPFFEKTWVTDIVGEKFNCDITMAAVDWNNAESQGIFFAEGNRPDVLLCRWVPPMTLRNENLIRSFPLEWLYTYMPDYMAAIEGIHDREIVQRQVTMGGGDMAWGVPSQSEAGTYGFNTIFNMSWANAVGITKVPETLEELHDFAWKVTYEDPDGNGIDDTYGLSQAGNYTDFGSLSLVYLSYNTFPNTYFLQPDGSVISNLMMPGYKEALRTLAKWYDEGIIHPEFVTASYVDTCYAGIVGTYTHRAVYGINDVANISAETGYEWEICEGMKDMTGVQVTSKEYPNLFASYPIYFGADATDEMVQRAMQILNYCLATEEGILLTNFLSYGDTIRYKVNDDGSIQRNEELVAMEQIQHSELGISFCGIMASQVQIVPTLPYAIAEILQRMNDMKTIYKGLNFEITPTDQYPTAQSVITSPMGIECRDLQNNYAMSVIIGETDLEASFDGFVAEWRRAGGQEILDLFNANAIRP